MSRRDEERGFIARFDTTLDLPDFPRKEIIRCYRNFHYRLYRDTSLLKALAYKVYYSRLGEKLIRLIGPSLKEALFRRIVEGRKRGRKPAQAKSAA